MKDQQFLRLSDHWRLAHDRHQWILQARRRNKGREKWQPVAFIASEKRVLTRVLREKGVELAPDVYCALERLPERFRDWIVQQGSCHPEPRHSKTYDSPTEKSARQAQTSVVSAPRKRPVPGTRSNVQAADPLSQEGGAV